MTNELTVKQAVGELKAMKKHIEPYMSVVGATAYDMAIKALEQQPSEDTEVIKVSKGAVKARQGRFVIYDVEWLKKNFYATEEKIYGQPKQPCEDCISRKAVDKIINKWLSHPDYELKDKIYDMTKMIHKLPPVTPKGVTVTDFADKCKECGKIQNELSEDVVSREDILVYISKLLSGYLYDEERERLEDLTVYIAEMPSVTPQRPKGKWIKTDEGFSPYECSECEKIEFKKSKFCPNCGAEMEVQDADSD